MIHVEMNFGEKEKDILVDLSLEDSRQKKFQKTIRIILIPLSIFVILCGLFASDPPLVIIGLVILLLVLFALKPYQKFVIKTALNRMDSKMTSGIRIYDINEEGITIKSELGEGQTNWNGFISSGEKENYIWIRRIDNQMILIEKNNLSSEELEELNGYLANIEE